jgi:transposase InsO family protein
MPWKETTTMSLKRDFVELAQAAQEPFSQLCRRFGITRRTGYKWLQRVQAAGEAGLGERSRRPQHSPSQTPAAREAQVLAVRDQHPAWGGRKIRRVLQAAGCGPVPAASTITAILRRHDKLDPQEGHKHTPFQRFEREAPNQLWQMDFKGYFALSEGGYCHPLTVLDDHSRFLVGLRACPDQTRAQVQHELTGLFRQYGLPEQMLMDNGAPWGDDRAHPYTQLSAWLLRLGIGVLHGRPYHPQTQGKEERLHRTLQAELLSRSQLASLAESQAAFDAWREVYNGLRPHEALQLQPPATRYGPSPRPFPEVLPPVEYPPGVMVRKVDSAGRIGFQGRACYVGKAFRGLPVALRPGLQESEFAVFFCHQKVATLRFQR